MFIAMILCWLKFVETLFFGDLKKAKKRTKKIKAKQEWGRIRKKVGRDLGKDLTKWKVRWRGYTVHLCGYLCLSWVGTTMSWLNWWLWLFFLLLLVFFHNFFLFFFNWFFFFSSTASPFTSSMGSSSSFLDSSTSFVVSGSALSGFCSTSISFVSPLVFTFLNKIWSVFFTGE